MGQVIRNHPLSWGHWGPSPTLPGDTAYQCLGCKHRTSPEHTDGGPLEEIITDQSHCNKREYGFCFIVNQYNNCKEYKLPISKKVLGWGEILFALLCVQNWWKVSANKKPMGLKDLSQGEDQDD